jgi:competence protein ComEC
VRLIWLGGAWLAGIALGLGRDLGPWQAAAGWVALALLALALLLPQWWRALLAAALLLAAVTLGAWRATLVRYPPADLPPGTITAIRGQVLDWPVRGAESDTAVVAVEAVRIADAWQGGEARLRVDLPLAPAVGRGDQVEVYGNYRPTEAITLTSFRDSLARQGLQGQFQGYSSRIRDTGRRDDLATWRVVKLAALEEALRRHVPGAEGALVTGVLLGDARLLPDATRAAFSTTSTSHVMALSGWNVALIAGLCALIGRRLRRDRSRLWMLGSVLAIWAFVLFVGTSPTLVRAAIMGTLYLLAEAVGRRGDALTALAASAIVMTAIAPATLLDIGFQLSCAATVGLIVGSEPCAAALLRLRLPAPIVAPAAATIVAELCTLPLMLHHFGRSSTVTLPTNLLIEPLVPVVMAGGALTAAAALLPGTLADFCGLLAWLPARLLLLIVEGFGAAPWAARSIPAPGWPIVGGLYTILGTVIGARSWLPMLRGTLVTLPAGTRPATAALLGGLAGGVLLGTCALLLLG